MKTVRLVLFSESRIQFMKEVSRHEDLVDEITTTLVSDPDTGMYDEGEMIGLVAGNYNIAMGGDYNQLDLDRMYDILIDKMRGDGIVRVLY